MINNAILNRRSVREFSDKLVSDDMIKEIIKAAQFAPTAMHNCSWEFVVIKDESSKEKLFKLTSTMFKQDSIKSASLILIPVIDTNKSKLAIQDLSVATENIFIQVTELGLGAFWKNVLPEEAENIKKFLNIPDNFTLINIIPIGYPGEKIKPHDDSKFIESKIHFEKW